MSDCKRVYKLGNPYNIINHVRKNKKSIIANSLEELINTSQIIFNFPIDANIKVVLEQDGTEVDDEEYFATLEKNTNLIILCGNQKWVSAETKTSTLFVVDDTDFSENHANEIIKASKYHSVQMKALASFLYKESLHVSNLTGTDLEILSDVDPHSVEVILDRFFIEQLKAVSSKFLADKRHVQESIALLEILSNNANIK